MLQSCSSSPGNAGRSPAGDLRCGHGESLHSLLGTDREYPSDSSVTSLASSANAKAQELLDGCRQAVKLVDGAVENLQRDHPEIHDDLEKIGAANREQLYSEYSKAIDAIRNGKFLTDPAIIRTERILSSYTSNMDELGGVEGVFRCFAERLQMVGYVVDASTVTALPKDRIINLSEQRVSLNDLSEINFAQVVVDGGSSSRYLKSLGSLQVSEEDAPWRAFCSVTPLGSVGYGLSDYTVGYLTALGNAIGKSDNMRVLIMTTEAGKPLWEQRLSGTGLEYDIALQPLRPICTTTGMLVFKKDGSLELQGEGHGAVHGVARTAFDSWNDAGQFVPEIVGFIQNEGPMAAELLLAASINNGGRPVMGAVYVEPENNSVGRLFAGSGGGTRCIEPGNVPEALSNAQPENNLGNLNVFVATGQAIDEANVTPLVQVKPNGVGDVVKPDRKMQSPLDQPTDSPACIGIIPKGCLTNFKEVGDGPGGDIPAALALRRQGVSYLLSFLEAVGCQTAGISSDLPIQVGPTLMGILQVLNGVHRSDWDAVLSGNGTDKESLKAFVTGVVNLTTAGTGELAPAIDYSRPTSPRQNGRFSLEVFTNPEKSTDPTIVSWGWRGLQGIRPTEVEEALGQGQQFELSNVSSTPDLLGRTS